MTETSLESSDDKAKSQLPRITFPPITKDSDTVLEIPVKMKISDDDGTDPEIQLDSPKAKPKKFKKPSMFTQKPVLITIKTPKAKRDAYKQAARELKINLSSFLREQLESLLFRAAEARIEKKKQLIAQRICPAESCKLVGLMVNIQGVWECPTCHAHGTTTPYTINLPPTTKDNNESSTGETHDRKEE